MRYFFLILFFYNSNVLSIEQIQPKIEKNFFDKTPAEQRNIFIEKFNDVISKKITIIQKTPELLTRNIGNIETVESLLIKSLELISNEKLDQASKVIDELIVLAPNFKLAHLIRGDILTAFSMSIDNFGGSAVAINSAKVTDFKKEAQRRIKGYLISHKNNKLPKFNIIPDEKNKYLIYQNYLDN